VSAAWLIATNASTLRKHRVEAFLAFNHRVLTLALESIARVLLILSAKITCTGNRRGAFLFDKAKVTNIHWFTTREKNGYFVDLNRRRVNNTTNKGKD
jgi:hypothetical protein